MVYARLLRRQNRPAEAVAVLDQAMGTGSLSLDARTQIHFALGRAHEAQCAHDQAFQHFRAGNRLKDAHYDPSLQADAVDRLINVFSGDAIDAYAHSSNASERPVFIVGMAQSGKSIVEQIVASHRDAYGQGELTALGEITEDLAKLSDSDHSYPESVPDMGMEHAMTCAKRYLKILAPDYPDVLRVTDTLPSNFMHLGFIELIFPGARVINVRRDPRDNVLACYFKNFGARTMSFAFQLDDIAHYYTQYERLMNHWRGVSKLQILDLRYEDLVTDTEPQPSFLTNFKNIMSSPIN